MKRSLWWCAAAAALTACQAEKAEQRAGQAIENGLAAMDQVAQVERVAMAAPSADGRLTGEAMVQDRAGRQRRILCTAAVPDPERNWECIQAIDETLLRQMEGQIADLFAGRAEVIEIAMRRGRDDYNMVGHARIRVPQQGELRLPCVAVRDLRQSHVFESRCGESAAAWAAAQPANLRGGAR